MKMIDKIPYPKEHSNRKYVQMYVDLAGDLDPFPVIVVGKNSIQKQNQVLDGYLDERDIPHFHMTPSTPFHKGLDYEVISMGDCSFDGKTWIFNEGVYRIGRENPRVDAHFEQMRRTFPELEIKVNTIYDQMVNI